MNDQTLLYRQINPAWVQGDRVTSQAFRPMPKDKNMLSAYNGDLITAEESWRHFTTQVGFASAGVLAVSVAECAAEQLPARPDPQEFPEHAVIDFSGLSNSACDKKSKILRSRAEARGWLYRAAVILVVALTLTAQLRAAEKTATIEPPAQDWGDSNMNLQQVIEHTMRSYSGVSNPGVDRSTMTGKILCGYQGWFAAQGDGVGRGWYHWAGRNGFEPGSCKIDLWPDVSELDPDERYATAFKKADGSAAEVYSAFNRKTVLRHFQWMQQYGLDGVFVQRFVGEVSNNPKGLRQFNVVLDHCREGANLYGRTYAVMYDLSGLGSAQMQRVMDDWKLLIDRMHVTSDPGYLHHDGKPVICVWGFGFNDRRRYTPTEGLELVKFLKDDPHYGGLTVMLGVPTYWRTMERDCVNDPTVHELILKADIVTPWTVGRYSNPKQATDYAQNTMKLDIRWCKERKKEFMPVVFPGFSWHNMNARSPSDQIPRLKGRFLWTQYLQAKEAGATMVYESMFDEVDEGTAIFKCTNDPPVGASKFITFDGLPSDFYLKLVGNAGKMLRGEIPASQDPPN